MKSRATSTLFGTLSCHRICLDNIEASELGIVNCQRPFRLSSNFVGRWCAKQPLPWLHNWDRITTDPSVNLERNLERALAYLYGWLHTLDHTSRLQSRDGISSPHLRHHGFNISRSGGGVPTAQPMSRREALRRLASCSGLCSMAVL